MGCPNCRPIYAERMDGSSKPKTISIEAMGREEIRPFSKWGRTVKAAWTDDVDGWARIVRGDVLFFAKPNAKVFITFI